MHPIWHIIDECVSTQDVLKSMPDRQGWTCVIADRQTGGRGRYGREWQSMDGNMFLSVYIEPEVEAAALPSLALVAGLALWQSVKPALPQNCDLRLKWPNDLLLGGKKLAGILLEKEGDGVIIGVGVNIKSYPRDTPYPATSMMSEAAVVVPDELARDFVKHLQKLVAIWKKSGFAVLKNDYQSAAIKNGSEIKLRLPDGEKSGAFAGVTETGAIIIDAATGRLELQAGEIMELADAARG